jgi:hypothetical protein
LSIARERHNQSRSTDRSRDHAGDRCCSVEGHALSRLRPRPADRFLEVPRDGLEVCHRAGSESGPHELRTFRQGSYSELIYPFCSNLVNVTPSTTDTTAKTWTFTPAIRSEDTVKTYTIENGGAVRAGKAAYGIVADLELTFNRTDGVSIGGGGFAQNFQDNITLTGSPTYVEDVPILPIHMNVYADDTFANIGTTKLTRDFNVVWRSTGRFGQIWPINSTLASFGAHVETEPTVQMELTTVKIDMAGKITNIDGPSDADGIKAVTYTFDAMYDAAWGSGQFLTIGLQNKTATL